MYSSFLEEYFFFCMNVLIKHLATKHFIRSVFVSWLRKIACTSIYILLADKMECQEWVRGKKTKAQFSAQLSHIGFGPLKGLF